MLAEKAEEVCSEQVKQFCKLLEVGTEWFCSPFAVPMSLIFPEIPVAHGTRNGLERLLQGIAQPEEQRAAPNEQQQSRLMTMEVVHKACQLHASMSSVVHTCCRLASHTSANEEQGQDPDLLLGNMLGASFRALQMPGIEKAIESSEIIILAA
eukprot:1155230-Pelagomonas_calceolata.AAC.1